jgi:hypothetical protein
MRFCEGCAGIFYSTAMRLFSRSDSQVTVTFKVTVTCWKMAGDHFIRENMVQTLKVFSAKQSLDKCRKSMFGRRCDRKEDPSLHSGQAL